MATPVFGLIETPWGPMAACRDGKKLVRTALPGEKAAALAARFADLRRDDAAFADLAEQVGRYFAGEAVHFDVVVDLTALPEFHRRTLAELRRVRHGQVVTYGELARRVGSPGAARAVGSAMARNPLPLIVPCHRVLASGGMGGFSAAGGTSLKARLLALEGVS